MTASRNRREVGERTGDRVATGAGGDHRLAAASPGEQSRQQHESSQASVAPRRRVTPDWRWRSFPVFAALVAGVLIDSLISPPSNTGGQVLRVLALLGFGYVLAHLFVTNVIVAGRVRRREKAIARGETPEDDFVEEAVYPKEESSHGAGGTDS